MKTQKILLTNHYSKSVYDIVLSQLPYGFEIEMIEKADEQHLLDKIGEADYLLASGRVRIGEEALCKAKNLKMIQRTGVGMDSFDLDAIKKYAIPIYVNQGINSVSVAEHTIMLMLSVLKRLNVLDSSVKKGEWRKQELGITCGEICGKTVGLIGIGNIAKKVVKMLSGFDVNIVYYVPQEFRLSLEEEKELNITYLSKEDLLSTSDIISLHCPLDESSFEIISFNEIALMKKNSIIINTSRGKLINLDSLIAALDKGLIKGAGLDVHYDEPIHKDYVLKKFDNVILTPHVAGVSLEAFSKMMHDALENINRFNQGKLSDIEDKKYVF